MSTKSMQFSFAGGVRSPSVSARIDTSKQANSAAILNNFIVREFGTASNRTGTEYLGEYLGAGGRFIPFQFSLTNTYMLEFTDEVIRIWKDGSLVLDLLENPVEIASPYETSEDLKLIRFEQSKDVIYLNHPSYKSHKLSRFSDILWTIEEVSLVPTLDIPWGTTGLRSVAVPAGTTKKVRYKVSRIDSGAESLPVPLDDNDESVFLSTSFDIDDPWPSTQRLTIGWNNIGAYFGGLYPEYTYTLSASGTNEYYLTHEASAGAGQSIPTELIADIKTIYMEQNVAINGVVSSLFENEWAIGNADGLSEDTLYVRLPSTAANPNPLLAWTAPANTGIYIQAKLISDGDSRYAVYKEEYGTWGLLSESDFPWVIDEDLTTDNSLGPQTDKEPFGCCPDTYPTAITTYEQRLWNGRSNSDPETFWGSKVGDPLNHNQSTILSETDAIERTLSSRGLSDIRHMIGVHNLLVLTGNQEFIIEAGPNSNIIDINCTWRGLSFEGCSDYPEPLRVGEDVLFVQRDGRSVMSINKSAQYSTYNTNKLGLLVESLTKGKKIVSWAYQNHPDSLLWCVLDDGTALSLTYNKDQKIIAWATHSTENGLYKDVASYESDGEDVVYFMVERSFELGGDVTYSVEKLTDRYVAKQEFAFFVDMGTLVDEPLIVSDCQLDGTSIKITTADHPHDLAVGDFIKVSDLDTLGFDVDGIYTVYTRINNTNIILGDEDGNVIDGTGLTGFVQNGSNAIRKGFQSVSVPHLPEGTEVNVLGDGSWLSDLTVDSSNNVVLTDDQDFFYTTVVGIPIRSTIKTLRLSINASPDVWAGVKKVSDVYFDVEGSTLDKVGRDLNHLDPIYSRTTENYDDPIELKTELVKVPFNGDWTIETAGEVYYVHDAPSPINILSMVYKTEMGGK